MSRRFPGFGEDFVWGVATASYQIEGAARKDDKGIGTWDVFCRRPGAIHGGHTGDVACDHFHRLDEDLDLLAELGVGAYRFSISWPRVLPEGVGAVSRAGLGFYDRLVDGLLRRGITPYVTLFHWDAPYELEKQGGFRNARSPDWFAEYCNVVSKQLGDRVRHWFTINEPHAFVEGGLRHGRHAPGLQLPLSEVLRAAHHTLLCHGRAVQILRTRVEQSWVAMAPVLVCATPASNQQADIDAARAWTFGATTLLRATGLWMDPIFGRGYPEELLALFGKDMPPVHPGDLKTIAQPLDACAFNLYDTPVVRAGDDGDPVVCPWPDGTPRTAFAWPVTPEGHYWGPRFAHERYQLPVLVTENGMSNRDWVALDGGVHDPARIDFIERHLQQLERAVGDGVDVAGYFHWSLMDNFEWNHGYRERFGLVHVDYDTLKRTKKDSFYAFRDFIR